MKKSALFDTIGHDMTRRETSTDDNLKKRNKQTRKMDLLRQYLLNTSKPIEITIQIRNKTNSKI